MTPGVNRDSHGLKVAKLAGMPTITMRVAEAALPLIRNIKSEGKGSTSYESLRDIGLLFAPQN